MHNIVKFDQLVAGIFAELYRNFPVRCQVNPYELLDYEEHGYLEHGTWVETLSDEDIKLYNDTIRWLLDTGYVIGDYRHVHHSDITLSLKGLELLKFVPESIQVKESIGEQLIVAVKSGAKDSAANLVSKALSSSNLMSQISNLFSTLQ